MTRSILVPMFAACCALTMVSCNSSSTGSGIPSSSTVDRVVASQGVTSQTSFGGLVLIDGQNDTLPRVAPLSGGTEPQMLFLSPARNILATFDAGSNSIFAVDTTKEMSLGQQVHLPCPNPPVPCLAQYSSVVVPTSQPIGYAAVPSATTNGFSYIGAVVEMNFSGGVVTATIAVPNAASVVANSSGSQLLVFSNDSNSVTVLAPGNALPPVDTSCLNNPPNAVCTVVPGFDRPVFAVVNGNTAYILNCGPQCGGTQASVAVFDLATLTITSTIPVEAATWALLNNSTLYVAGTPPTNNDCQGQNSNTGTQTAATACGRLDVIDLGSGTVTASGIKITDGYHDRMDLNVVGQLFIGSRDCTNIGDVNNPSGEVRGCLSIYNPANGSVIIPPDNGDVNGLQGFITRQIEYVAEGGYLRVYDVTTDTLLINDIITNGTIPVVGYVEDVKALDTF